MKEDNKSGGCGCLIFIIIIIIILFFSKGCNKEGVSKESTVATKAVTTNKVDWISEEEKNSINEKYREMVKETGKEFVSDFEYIYAVEMFRQKSMKIHEGQADKKDIKILYYYGSMGGYEIFETIENYSVQEFRKYLITINSEINEEIGKLSDNEIIFLKDTLLEEIYGEIVESDIKQFSVILNYNNFEKEEKLSREELDNIQKIIYECLEETEKNARVRLDIDKYKVEKGYKLTVNVNGELKKINVYYMAGDWRVFYIDLNSDGKVDEISN